MTSFRYRSIEQVALLRTQKAPTRPYALAMVVGTQTKTLIHHRWFVQSNTSLKTANLV